MKYKKITGSLALALIAVVAVFGYTTLTAFAASGVIQDAKGDAQSATESANNVDAGTPEDTARGYLDIKQVKVTKKKGTDQYVFSMVMAESIPQDFSNEVCYDRTSIAGDTTTFVSNPPNPISCFFAWNWNVDADESQNVGNDISPTVRWFKGKFQGVAFNSGAAIFFDTFTVKGATVSATLDASVVDALVGTSEGFEFAGATRNHRIDFGGDPLVGLADTTDISYWTD